MNGEILAVGPLPPPVHGYSLITSLVIERLRRASSIDVLDISPGMLVRGWRYHWTRLRRAVSALARLAWRGQRGGVLYLAIAGGAGIFYDLAFAAVARLHGYRLFVHHNAFSYINRRSAWTAALIAILGRNATHICLCPGMATRLALRYPRARQTLVLSNAALIVPPEVLPCRRAGARLCLGFLSNLIPEKGLDTAIEVLRGLLGMEQDVRLIVAGPALDDNTRRFLAGAAQRFGGAFEYRGAVYDAAKQAFFRDIDVLLFPTRYANEAQPLVVFEALGQGIPVIAANRGCIPDDLASGGIVVGPGHDFVSVAVAAVCAWIGDRDALRACATAAAARAREMYRAAQNDLDRIVERMTSDHGMR